MVSVKIAAGKRYVRRDGQVSGVISVGTCMCKICKDNAREYWDRDLELGYRVDGYRWSDKCDSDLDLVAEYVENLKDYITLLAERNKPTIDKLLKDPAFREAAEKLAQKLAHALLERPTRMLKRRKKQSRSLWVAACRLLWLADVPVVHNHDIAGLYREIP